MTRETFTRNQVLKLKHDIAIDANAEENGGYIPEPRTLLAGSEYRVEGWVDDLSTGDREQAVRVSEMPPLGRETPPPCPTWFVMAMNGNPAALQYFYRMADRPALFRSGDVLYGHIGALGYMLHRSEVE